MIEYDKKNPGHDFADAIHQVQRNASENTYMYAKWKEEAGNTVRAYLGGAEAGSGGSVSIETEIPYAFERKNNIEERKVNIALQDRVMAAFLEDTKAKILQQTAYEKLIAVLGKTG